MDTSLDPPVTSSHIQSPTSICPVGYTLRPEQCGRETTDAGCQAQTIIHSCKKSNKKTNTTCWCQIMVLCPRFPFPFCYPSLHASPPSTLVMFPSLGGCRDPVSPLPTALVSVLSGSHFPPFRSPCTNNYQGIITIKTSERDREEVGRGDVSKGNKW